jgi:SAM-dependent methyltransferase
MALAGKCNLCGSLVVKINSGYFGTRCLRCRSTQIHRAVGIVLDRLNIPSMASVYELSSRGALFHCLRRKFSLFYYSEYFDNFPLGLLKNSIICQDVQNLVLQDQSFDLVTSTEVFEHVPDDRKGFAEIYRVLKPQGYFVFTVPLSEQPITTERCYLKADGTIEHILEPEYHGDRIRGQSRVLAFRNYGLDIVERLEKVGFQVEIQAIVSPPNLINHQKVIVAHKL